jgi:hypothetical protein
MSLPYVLVGISAHPLYRIKERSYYFIVAKKGKISSTHLRFNANKMIMGNVIHHRPKPHAGNPAVKQVRHSLARPHPGFPWKIPIRL